MACGQLAPGRTQAGRARDPEQHLQIAQAAGAFLAVRFQAVWGVLKACVALLEFEFFSGVEGACIELLAHAGVEIACQLRIAGQVPRLDQRRLHRDVVCRTGEAFIQGADAVSGFEANIPKLTDQRFYFCTGLSSGGARRFQSRFRQITSGVGCVWLVGQQDQHVNIGARVQLAAPIAADGNQRGAVFETGCAP